MSKSNLVLGVVFLVVFGIWAVRNLGDEETISGPAERLFPEFNREAADGILIEGGWKGMTYAYARSADGWVLASAGGYPVQSGEVDKFVDAVSSLRRDNLVGESETLQKTSRTDAKGRKVTILRQGEPMAEFVIGKHPKGEWQAYFVRRGDEQKIYRTKTISGSGEAAAPNPFGNMGGPTGPRAFDWAQYANNTFKFTKTQIWNLDDGEVREVWIERPGDMFNVKLIREEDEQWALVEKDQKSKADTAAVEDITGSLSYLAFEEVVGAFDDEEARKKYGLDQPTITLILTLRREVKEEKKPDEEKKPGDEEKKPDDEEKKPDDEEKNDEPKYETFTRTITVGSKIKLPKSYDDEKDEKTEAEYYAIKVSGDLEDGSKAAYIYLVDDYKIGPLKKSLEDLKLKEEKKDDPKGDEPKGDQPKSDDPKSDDPKSDDPKSDDPKTDDPKTDDPKSDDPKSDDPKSDDPKSDDPKSDDPKSDDPKGTG
jgi:hypothetical protein